MTIEELNDSILLQALSNSASAHRKFVASVRPVFAATKGIRVEHVGSCLLLRVDAVPYVVTAAHILDRVPQQEIYVGLGRKPVQIVGLLTSTAAPGNDRNNDRRDIAFWPASEEVLANLDGCTFMNERDCSHNRAAFKHRVYVAIGYPLSRNKRSVDNAMRKLKPTSWSYTGDVVDLPKLATEMDVSGDDHLFLAYEKYSKDLSGRKVRSVSPQGLSGGALIDLGNHARPETFEPSKYAPGFLAGMIIERYKQHGALVAIRIQQVIDAIRQAPNHRTHD